MKSIKIGIAGTGVVASGVVNILKRNADEISRRAGRDIEVAVVSSRTRSKAEALVGACVEIVDDIMDVEGDETLAGKALHKDAAAGKATFVTLMGLERAREQAALLVEQAIAHLAGFGEEAGLLRAIARYVVERDH